MNQILTESLPAIRLICQKTQLKKLWVFGSVLNDDFHKDSDIDFLLEFEPSAYQSRAYYDQMMTLISELQNLLARKIDVLDYPSLKNPYLLEVVEENKYLVYASESEKVSV